MTFGSAPITGQNYRPSCGCDVPPWEECGCDYAASFGSGVYEPLGK